MQPTTRQEKKAPVKVLSETREVANGAELAPVRRMYYLAWWVSASKSDLNEYKFILVCREIVISTWEQRVLMYLNYPHAARLTLKLEGTVEEFDGDAFVRESAEALGVDPADIVLTGVRKGSVIVDVC